MRIGFGKRLITPKLEDRVELSGYGYYLDRFPDEVLDDLEANSLVIEGNNKTLVALVSVDLVGIDDYSIKKIKDNVANAANIPNDQIIISATHTHSGPATVNLLSCGSYNSGYADYILTPRVTDSIIEAKLDMKEGELGFNKIQLKGLAYNRAGDDTLDSELNLMKISNGNDGYFINYACHPVVLGKDSKKISRDYPGDVADALFSYKNNLEGVLWTSGCCGDVNPNSLRKRYSGEKVDELEEKKILGNKIAEEIIFLTAGMQLDSYDVFFANKKVKLPFDQQFVYDRKGAVTNFKKKYPDGDKTILANFEKYTGEVEKRIQEKGLPECRTANITGVKLGNHILIGLPGEVFSSTGLKIKSRHPGTIISGYTNGLVGYIPPREEYQKEGSYAAGIGQLIYNHRPFTQDCEERLIAGVDELMKEFK